MAKSNLLQAVCAVAMLAAVPVIAPGAAQAQRDAGMTSPDGTPNPEAKQPVSGPTASSSTKAVSTMSPANNGGTGTGSSTMADTQSAHHQTMARPVHAMGSRTDTSQNGEVDRLNDQSLHAAEQGQMFSATGSSGSNPTK